MYTNRENLRNYITLETAKKLISSTWSPSNKHWCVIRECYPLEPGEVIDVEDIERFNISDLYIIPTATLWEIQQWIRDEYNISIEVNSRCFEAGKISYYAIQVSVSGSQEEFNLALKDEIDSVINPVPIKGYPTYEEALSNKIDEVINTICQQ